MLRIGVPSLCPANVDRLGWIGQPNALLFKPPQDGEVDRLPGVRVQAVAGIQDMIHYLEVEGKLAVLLEMVPVKACMLLQHDDLLDDRGNPLHLVALCLGRDAEGEDHTSLGHPSIVADPAAQEIVVGDYELLARHAPDARALEANVFHSALVVAQHDLVAHDKGPVQGNG